MSHKTDAKLKRGQGARGRMDRGAFTLLELAVVLAAVGVMAAMMIPALARSKRGGQSSQCESNLKQLAQAWTMYADENNDRVVNLNTYAKDSNGNMVPVVGAAQGMPWRTEISLVSMTLPPGMVTGSPAAQKYLIQMGYKQPIPTSAGPLYAYAPEVGLMHCPADFRANLPASALGFAYSGPYGWDSYSGSSLLNGEDWSDTRAILKRSAVTRPGDKFIWTEAADMRGENLGSWRLYPLGTAAFSFAEAKFSDSPAAFHDRSAAFNFCDGHVEIHRWSDPTTIAFANDTSSNKSSDSTEVMANNHQNADIMWCASHYAGSQNP